MVSIALIAIGAALALPSFQDMVEKRRVTHGAEQVAAFMNTAQGLAVRNDSRVTISVRQTDAAWCVGLAEDAAICDCLTTPASCQVSARSQLIGYQQVADNVELHSVSGAGNTYYIDPVRGFVLPCDPDSSSATVCGAWDLSDQVTLSDPLGMEFRSPTGDFRLNLVVNNSGRVVLCSAGESHAVPGYDVCPADGGDDVGVGIGG